MLSTLRNAWRIPDIRKKMIFTMLMLLVVRLGAAIPVPYMNKEIISNIFNASQGGILQFLDMMAGGTFSSFSIFATNIYPYITASIILQLLTIAIPKLEELAKEGEEGKKKILREYDARLSKTIMHRDLGREVSYRYLIRLECYKLIKDLIGEQDYQGFKIWW